MVTVESRFPKRCVHCGGKRELRREKTTLARMSAAAGVRTIFLGATFGLAGALLAGSMSDGVKAEYYTCKTCRNERIDTAQASRLILALAVACFIAAPTVGLNGGSLVLTALFVVTGVAVMAWATRRMSREVSRTLRVVKDTAGAVWVAGIHPAVRETFPEKSRATLP